MNNQIPGPILHLKEGQPVLIILAVWEIADTGNGFYQVIDFNFTN